MDTAVNPVTVSTCTDASHPFGIHRHGDARFVRRAHCVRHNK
jgi:hypothetical protein